MSSDFPAEEIDRIFSLIGSEMRISKRRLIGLVSQDLLDFLKRHAAHHQPRRARVPEIVEAQIRDARFLEQRFPSQLDPVKRLARQLSMFAVAEHVGTVDPARQILERFRHQLVHGHGASSTAFGHVDRDVSAFEIDVGPFQHQDLAFSHAGVDGEGEDGLEIDRNGAARGAALHVEAVAREEQLLILFEAEVPDAHVVFAQEADPPREGFGNGNFRQKLPLENQIVEALQHGEVTIDRGRFHFLQPIGLELLDRSGSRHSDGGP